MDNDDDIVISGLSGRFPECNDISEFWQNLMNKTELSSCDARRWPVGYIGLPSRSGKVMDADKIDADFFKLSQKEADNMDPQIRLLHEVTYEAIWDSGINPEELRESKTSILVGLCYDDNSKTLTNDLTQTEKDRAVLKHGPVGISKIFGFTGVAFEADTACASSFSCFHEGLILMKAGHCENVIVGGVACHLTPGIAKGFMEMKMISPEGRSKCLDAEVNGYCRSEAVAALFLQKRKNAKRIYASVVACNTNADGFKPEGITFPGFETQKRLLEKTIKDSRIDPLKIDYIEAHVTGTAAGDPIESRAILEAYRKDSKLPIMFGCLKSNIGHTEGASGVCALTKAALIFQKRCIPQNINYKNPNPNIEGLMEKRIIPVVEKTPFHGNIIPVNSFGFGGVNVHAVLKANEKVVTEDSYVIVNDIPRLININGRTEEGVKHTMNWIESNRNEVTKEFLSLLNDVSKTPLKSGMYCRGYMILDEKKVLARNVTKQQKQKQLWFVYSSYGCQWTGMAKGLIHLKPFADTLEKCANVLKPFDVDLTNLLLNESSNIYSNVIDAVTSIVSIQIALTELLKFVGLEPEGIIGHSIGEVVAGYADGCLDIEEAMLTAYYIAKCSIDSPNSKGSMAAIGLRWEEAQHRCPPGVYLACDNSETAVTVSGKKEDIADFIEKLHSERIYAKEVNSCDIAYHCPLVEDCFHPLVNELSKVIKNPKNISNRWISTSESLKEKRSVCDATYYANNIISSVHFREATKRIANNACIVEVGPNAILTPILRSALSNGSFVSLMTKSNGNSVKELLSGIGDIYANGYNPSIEKLYPEVNYPVPRETASLSHLLKWDHSKSHFLANFVEYFCLSRERVKKEVDFMDRNLQFIEGHRIDGRKLFPATGYLYYVWSQFALNNGMVDIFDLPVEFRNVTLHRATIVPKGGVTFFEIYINDITGRFTIGEKGSVCVSGTICEPGAHLPYTCEQSSSDHCFKISTNDIYKELRIRGYDYGPSFQGLVEANSDGSEGKVKWTGHWISFTDSMLHLSLMSSDDRSLRVPTFIEYLKCDPHTLFSAVEKNEVLTVKFDKYTNIGMSEGVVVKGVKVSPISRRQENQIALLESQTFSPFKKFVETSEVRRETIVKFVDSCVALIEKLKLNNFSVDENEEKSDFNNERIEEFAFYRKLVESLKEKRNVSTFLDSLSQEDKRTVHFSSNIKETLEDQLKKVFENVTEKHLNWIEVNETTASIKETFDDISSKFLAKTEYYVKFTEKIESGSTSNMDLIVYKDLSTELIANEQNLKTEEEMITFFKSCFNSLKSGAFLLVLSRKEATTLEKELFSAIKKEFPILMNEHEIIQIANKTKLTLIGETIDDLGFVSLLFRKIEATTSDPIVIVTQTKNYEWVDAIKEELKSERQNTIWLIGKKDEANGVVGLTRCLRKEPGGHRIRCLVSSNEEIPKEILEKDLSFNVCQKNIHGTLVHQLMNEKLIETDHAYLDVKTKGDLSSFRWFEAPHKNWVALSDNEKNAGDIMIHVYYAALNFKDIMVATGRIPLTAYPSNNDAGCLGIEYSGIDENGNRVMGCSLKNSMATTLITNKNGLTFPVPLDWTLEEAATVPVVYSTVYYAMIIRAKMLPKESILIHAGSGGVGQAAISVCLAMGCEVFTSVGTEQKKRFLKKLFPQLQERNFVNSRDITFEEHILKETNGKGVDLILNSLAEEKLRASINCLADFGRFVEIGKYDIIQNNRFDQTTLFKNKTFHVICVAHLMYDAFVNKSSSALSTSQIMKEMFVKGLKNGEIKPLQRTIFDKIETEKAFRFMASGKHIGKVLIKMVDEVANSAGGKPLTTKAVPRTIFHPSKVYIVVGGLGGIGLEVSHWLMQRGATKLVLTSRRGIKDAFQRYMIKRMEAEGVKVTVSVNDCSSFTKTENLIDECRKLGEIGGIFNLAMVLNDALLANQTQESFQNVCAPKVDTTQFLDEITRKKCPHLDYFVCFSSAACGRGNAGQSNYGFANSVMETICEKRKRDNLHGLAVQWGAVGDVGFVMENFKVNDIVIAGTLPQRIPSCMNSLDVFMNASDSVCSSIVPVDTRQLSDSNRGDLLKTICHVLGVNDVSALDDNTTIGDLGMDSLMAVEIKQGLERDYNIILSTQEIRQLTVKNIKDISTKKLKRCDSNLDETDDHSNIFELPQQLFTRLDTDNPGIPIFFLPPIEGDFNLMKPLVKHIARPVVGINWVEAVDNLDTVEEVAAFYVKKLREMYPEQDYDLVAYSFGSLIALEMCIQLQEIEMRLAKSLIILDGDPSFLKASTLGLVQKANVSSEKEAFKEILLFFVSLFYPTKAVEELKSQLIALTSKEEQIEKAVFLINSFSSSSKCSSQLLTSAAERYFKKLKRIHFYEPRKFKGNATLIHSSNPSPDFHKTIVNKSHDLRQFVEGNVDVVMKVGDHKSFLTSNYKEIGESIDSQLFFTS